MKVSKPGEAIRQVAQVDRDGAAFFRRANRLVADPRVKFIFLRAAEEYGNAVHALERLRGSKAKAKVPAFFPFAEYERIDCYVCGYEASADDIPEVCPSCGAARYAFEREVSQNRAWDLVARTTKATLAFARKAAGGVTDPKAKAALAKAMDVRKGLLAEAREAMGRAEGVAP